MTPTSSLGQSTAIEDGLVFDLASATRDLPHLVLRLGEGHDIAYRNAEWECKRICALLTDSQLDLWLYWLDEAAKVAREKRAQRWAGRIDYRQPTMSVAERYEAQRERTAARLPKSDDLLAGLCGGEEQDETEDILLEEL